MAVTIYDAEKAANYQILKEKESKIISIYKNWNIPARAFNKIFGKYYIPYTGA